MGTRYGGGKKATRAGNNPKEPINVIQRWVVSCLELGHFAFSPGLGTVESRSLFRRIDRSFGGDSAGTERGDTKKFEQPKRKHGDYRLAVDKTREAIDKKHEKEKKLECEPRRWVLSRSRSNPDLLAACCARFADC
jgi:hypothetical protein